jgi:hypothetical protein
MPLRFHQNTVERPLPSSAAKFGATARFTVYGAIRNWRRLPIFVLPVDAVLERLRKVVEAETQSEDNPKLAADTLYAETVKSLESKAFTKKLPPLQQHVLDINLNRPGNPGGYLV